MVKKNITINDLAVMVKTGFDQMGDDIRRGFSATKAGFDILGQGQEDIKLRLDSVAYRFELVELQKRVEILEKRAGIKK